MKDRSSEDSGYQGRDTQQGACGFGSERCGYKINETKKPYKRTCLCPSCLLVCIVVDSTSRSCQMAMGRKASKAGIGIGLYVCKHFQRISPFHIFFWCAARRNCYWQGLRRMSSFIKICCNDRLASWCRKMPLVRIPIKIENYSKKNQLKELIVR